MIEFKKIFITIDSSFIIEIIRKNYTDSEFLFARTKIMNSARLGLLDHTALHNVNRLTKLL